MIRLTISILLFILCFASRIMAASELVIADFEIWPNNVGGTNGVYGSLEPDWSAAAVPSSWIYNKDIHDQKNFSDKNIHKGNSSWRLVHAMGAKPGEAWGNFTIQLGPVLNDAKVPVEIQSLDVSRYRQLTLWVKGEKGGEKITVSLRDSHATNYFPQFTSAIQTAGKTWKKIAVALDKTVTGKVDLKNLAAVSVNFDRRLGNAPGATVYVDDFLFSP